MIIMNRNKFPTSRSKHRPRLRIKIIIYITAIDMIMTTYRVIFNNLMYKFIKHKEL